MAKKPAEITSDDVDNMTDDQIAEMTAAMRQESPETVTDDPPAEAKTAQNKQEEAKAEEKPADTPSSDDDEGKKTETVDFKRYDYERNRRKKAEEERERERAEWQRRFDELLKARQGPEKQEEAKPAIPSEDEDPLATIRWLKEQVTGIHSQRAQETAEEKARREAWEQEQAILGEAVQEFQVAAQGDGTVQEAYDALRQSFYHEAVIYGIPANQMQAHLQQIEMQHILFARQRNIPIADYVKRLAQSRGWAPKQQAPAIDDAKAADAQKRAKTLSNGGGSPGVSDTITAEQILSMDDKDFDAMIAKYGSLANALAAQ